MHSLQSHLNSLDFSHQLVTVNNLIHRAEPKTTFWGNRVVKVSGFTGSVYLDDIARKILTAGKQRSEAGDLSPEERSAGMAVITKLYQFYGITDTQVKNSNCFTRLLNWIREFSCGIPYYTPRFYIEETNDFVDVRAIPGPLTVRSRPQTPTPLNPATQRVTVVGPQNLIAFYLHQELNNNGVGLHEIHTWDDNRLESQHDYIQWLFPLRAPSGHNPTAPTLDDTTINAFRTNSLLRGNLLGSFNRMLRFYGLQMSQSVNESTMGITRAPNFNARAAVWLTPGNHNFLRITRIITSLDLLGFPIHSRAFLSIMQNIAQNEGNGIVGNSLRHWQRALRN